MDGAAVRFLRREGEHGRDGLGRLDLDGVTARRAGEVGRVGVDPGPAASGATWSVRSDTVSASTTGSWSTTPAGTSTSQRREQPVPPRAEQNQSRRRRRRSPPRRRSTTGPPAATARQHDRRGPQHPGHAPPRRPPRRVYAAGIVPRRRRPLAWTNDRPNSAVNTTNDRDGRRQRPRPTGSSRRHPGHDQRRARQPQRAGTPTRTMVSERTEAISERRASRSPSRPTPDTGDQPDRVTARIDRCSTAPPPTIATNSHARRASHASHRPRFDIRTGSASRFGRFGRRPAVERCEGHDRAS